MAARIPPPAKPPTNPPNQTLYLTNLPSKLPKPTLRHSLYTLFSTYGPVLDIVAMRTAALRGQAWVVFRDVRDSTLAMRALQGFEFFGMGMKVRYARGKSDVVARLDGTLRVRDGGVGVGGGGGTELQREVFGGAPSGVGAGMGGKGGEREGGEGGKVDGGKGVKRGREEEESDEEVAMEEDSDAPMEGSSDEDE